MGNERGKKGKVSNGKWESRSRKASPESREARRRACFQVSSESARGMRGVGKEFWEGG